MFLIPPQATLLPIIKKMPKRYFLLHRFRQKKTCHQSLPIKKALLTSLIKSLAAGTAINKKVHFPWELGWSSGESARLLPMFPWFNSRTRRHMWVEFLVGSRPSCKGFFSRHSGFPPSSKNQHFQFELEFEGHRFFSGRLLCATLIEESQFI